MHQPDGDIKLTDPYSIWLKSVTVSSQSKGLFARARVHRSCPFADRLQALSSVTTAVLDRCCLQCVPMAVARLCFRGYQRLLRQGCGQEGRVYPQKRTRRQQGRRHKKHMNRFWAEVRKLGLLSLSRAVSWLRGPVKDPGLHPVREPRAGSTLCSPWASMGLPRKACLGAGVGCKEGGMHSSRRRRRWPGKQAASWPR